MLVTRTIDCLGRKVLYEWPFLSQDPSGQSLGLESGSVLDTFSALLPWRKEMLMAKRYAESQRRFQRNHQDREQDPNHGYYVGDLIVHENEYFPRSLWPNLGAAEE